MAHSLFERIGGRGTIDAVVDVFYERVLGDARIVHFFEGVDMGLQRRKQKSFLACAFGGPVKYDGKDLRMGHAHLDLREKHFAAVLEHLQGTLEELGVAEDLVKEVMGIAASTHDDVLGL